MTTVEQIFTMAINAIDQQDEITGKVFTEDTKEYKFRTISILNTVIPQLYPYSKTYVIPPSGRPEPAFLLEEDVTQPDLEQTIPLDDTLSMSLLPLYLASMLLSEENTDLSAYFMNLFREAKADLKNKIPREFESINTPYGLF